jgi:hypothetical protein
MYVSVFLQSMQHDTVGVYVSVQTIYVNMVFLIVDNSKYKAPNGYTALPGVLSH